MPFSPLMFLVDRSVAQRFGVDSNTANRDAMVGSMVRPSMLGLVLVSALARNQMPSGTSSTTGLSGGQTGIKGILPGSSPTIETIVPDTAPVGDHIAILGSGFKAPGTKVTVWFGKTEATKSRVERDNAIWAVVPP